METSVEIKDNNIAVTRDGCVYLYKLLNGKYQMYSLSSDITGNLANIGTVTY